MGRRTSLQSLKQISDINLTPLMDLTFILLITFIITFPLIEQGIPVNLPVGEAEELDASQMRTITVDVNGELYLNEDKVNKDELTSAMQDIGVHRPDLTVMVRADQEIAYRHVVEVMQILHRANITRMALVTEVKE